MSYKIETFNTIKYNEIRSSEDKNVIFYELTESYKDANRESKKHFQSVILRWITAQDTHDQPMRCRLLSLNTKLMIVHLDIIDSRNKWYRPTGRYPTVGLIGQC